MATERETNTLRAFERVKQDIGDISVHAARLNEWRAEITTAFPTLDAAATEFGRQEREADKQAEVQWVKLKAARHELALAYRKFEELDSEEQSNKRWAELLDQIAEANIPDYKAKAEAERKRWEQLFRSNVLQRMDQA